MRIGLINELHGRQGGDSPAPSWESVRARAGAAEKAGFDIFVFEDALVYKSDEGPSNGVWESVSMAAALAATTASIRIGHSVVNSPYRSPAMTASIATTLDEISGGRYTLGIGAGNTPDSDYEAFGFPTDHRYGRFAEAIQILQTLLKTGESDFKGEFYQVEGAELVLRGPSPAGPPINIAAGGPKMLRLAATYGDEWNWWTYNETAEQFDERMSPIIETLEDALTEVGRSRDDLVRTIDVYSVLPGGLTAEHGMENIITGTDEEIAERLISFEEMGFEEVRVDLWPRSVEAIEAMAPVVDLVHQA